MGPTPVDLLATVLAYDDARGAPVSNAPHSGYQRIDAGHTALVMDTGRPPPLALSQEAHAGCLSFELSWNLHRLVINCGLPAVNKENWRQVARATTAHSTVTFNDASSCRFLESGSLRRLLFGMPIVGGPRDVRVTREDTPEGANLLASHDGYADDFAVIHNRSLRLSPDGRVLDGEDSFTPHRRRQPAGGHGRRIRHPLSSASLDQGQPAIGRPRRHSVAAGQRAVDIQYLRRRDQDRGKRVPVRLGRPAPHRADRDLRPCPRNFAGALDLPPYPAGAARHPLPSGRTSRNCRCDVWGCRLRDEYTFCPLHVLAPSS